MEKLKFVPLPDPSYPETLVQENIDILKRWGIIPQEIFAVASRRNWGLLGTGVFPEEGSQPKYWRDDSVVNAGDAASGKYYYLFLAGETSVKRSNTEAAGFSHPVFEIYGQHTAQFYRDYAPLFDGRVPVLEWVTVTAPGAKRLNVADGTPLPYPFGAVRYAVPGGSSFPTDCALRFRPGTDIVEAFRKEPFVQHFGDPANYTQPEGVMAAPAVPSPVVVDTTVHGVGPSQTAPPAPPAPTPASGVSTYEGMDLDNSSGEAICNGIRTGWYFERPVQVVPVASNPETGRSAVAVTPWGYATASTAQRIMELMQAHTQRQLELFKGDPNPQFPVSVLQRYVGVQGQPRRVSVNAGLIASYIARTTAEVSDGKGGKKTVQTVDPHIAEALASLDAGME